MPKRKKTPKLPNGYGSIKYLGKGRRNPYAVHPPVTEFTQEGIPVTPRALCYVDNWYKGFAVLTAYKAGTYTPGMELEFEAGENNHDKLTQAVLANYSRMLRIPEFNPGKTFAEMFEEFYHYRYERPQSKTYSISTRNASKTAFKNTSALHERPFAELRHKDLQEALDNCPLKHASLELILSLFHQMYEYAIINELVDKDYSAAVRINRPDDDERGVPFTDDELRTLWQHKDNPTAEMLLIMCYSGYRITAYRTIEVNQEEWFFCGGVKTASSKNRIVPIHTAIRPLVLERIRRMGGLLIVSNPKFRTDMYAFLNSVGIQRHSPHDCRHTFSTLCEKYGVNENDRKRMLGHSFGSDVTNAVYGHRTLEDLRTEIEKIKVLLTCY